MKEVCIYLVSFIAYLTGVVLSLWIIAYINNDEDKNSKDIDIFWATFSWIFPAIIATTLAIYYITRPFVTLYYWFCVKIKEFGNK